MRQHRAWIGSLVLGILAAWSITPALAGNRRSVALGPAVTLQGQQIPPGEYQLVWTPNGNPNEIEVTVERGHKVFARATARRVEESTPSTYDSIVYSRSQDGAREIVEIRFAGAKEIFRLDGSAQARK